jgi:cytochrome c2
MLLHRSVSAVAVLIWTLVASSGVIAADQAALSRPLEYVISCEGCHKADGSGQPGVVPAFTNHIASYLHIPAGRAFLIGVPGVSQSVLSDEEIASVMNWLVRTYDPEGIPGNFMPFTATEVATLRKNPISDTIRERLKVENQVISSASPPAATIAQQANSVDAQSIADLAKVSTRPEQPAAFAICAACHPVSADGANGMGPNLLGIIDRSSGTHPGFNYSRSMRTSAIVWSEAALDAFLESPTKTVPNTSMIFSGESSAEKRKDVINYLKALQQL